LLLKKGNSKIWIRYRRYGRHLISYIKERRPLEFFLSLLQTKQGQNFREYFIRHKNDEIYENVIKPKKGQYDPENIEDYFQDNYEEGYITTNDNESINGKIKVINKKKSARFSMTDVHTFLCDLKKSMLHLKKNPKKL